MPLCATKHGAVICGAVCILTKIINDGEHNVCWPSIIRADKKALQAEGCGGKHTEARPTNGDRREKNYDLLLDSLATSSMRI